MKNEGRTQTWVDDNHRVLEHHASTTPQRHLLLAYDYHLRHSRSPTRDEYLPDLKPQRLADADILRIVASRTR
ncbi:unnamed protein product [Alternaria burnsii]|nr:unnamed protein product [Alternaria burnsii]